MSVLPPAGHAGRLTLGHTMGPVVRHLSVCLLAIVTVALSACGSPPRVSSPSPTAPPTATPTLAPDTESLTLVSQGLGAYQAVVVPVAVIHNAATRTGVRGVVVHFVPTRGGRALTPLDSPAVTLYPGQTLAVTADCTDTCNNTGTVRDPDGLMVTIGAGTWAPLPGSALTATAVRSSCTSGCGGGHGQWDVAAVVGSPELSQGTRVDVFTWCTNAGGAIVGGSPPSVVLWPQSGGMLSLTLHAILSSPPSTCHVGASAPI